MLLLLLLLSTVWHEPFYLPFRPLCKPGCSSQTKDIKGRSVGGVCRPSPNIREKQKLSEVFGALKPELQAVLVKTRKMVLHHYLSFSVCVDEEWVWGFHILLLWLSLSEKKVLQQDKTYNTADINRHSFPLIWRGFILTNRASTTILYILATSLDPSYEERLIH